MFLSCIGQATGVTKEILAESINEINFRQKHFSLRHLDVEINPEIMKQLRIIGCYSGQHDHNPEKGMIQWTEASDNR